MTIPTTLLDSEPVGHLDVGTRVRLDQRCATPPDLMSHSDLRKFSQLCRLFRDCLDGTRD